MSRYMVYVKRALVAVVLLLVATVAFAQSGTPVDVVYLKNGSVVRGSLMEYTVGKDLKIKTADGSVFVYTADEIDRVAREFVKPEAKVKTDEPAQLPALTPVNLSTRKKGLNVYFEAGIGGASQLFAAVTPAISVGYRTSPKFYIGGGFAINNYLIMIDELANPYHFGLPLFVDARFDVGKKHSFFFDARFGAAVMLTGNDKSGAYLGLTPGVRFALPGGGGLNLGLGYDGALGVKVEVKHTSSLSAMVQGAIHTIMFKFGVDF